MSGPMAFDDSRALLEQVNQAIVEGTPLAIRGGGSKAFLGRELTGKPLPLGKHRGVVSYDPTELVITARAGTPLVELQACLAEAGQMLACEPPNFDGRASVGGMVAAGLSGPRRPWYGSVRDFVLGTRVITGHGKHLHFGGQVMKNVAGYDLSRLMAASFGVLGVITEVSLKVLPVPRCSASLRLDMDAGRALQKLAEWGQQPLPISAACHDGAALYLRLEGGEGSVASAHERLGGERIEDGFWARLRERQLPFFDQPGALWRLSLPFNVGPLELPGAQLLDWAGAQRWLISTADPATIRAAVSTVGGHATCFTPGHSDSPFQPLPAALLRYHRQLKQQLDPHGIFNPGHLYREV